MNGPLVSIIIPTYNRPNMLERAIDSALAQTYEHIEIIVVDDNEPGTDARKDTELVMGKYEGLENIKYIKHAKNLNGSAARNTGIKNSSGKYIAFLDDDDEFLPEKIRLQVQRLESLDETWGICYTHFIRKKNGVFFDKGIEKREGYLTTEILKGNVFISAGSNIMVRRDIVEEIGGFNESLRRRQDLEFLVRLSQKSKIACVPEVCFVVHKDDRSNSKVGEDFLRKNTEEYLSLFSDYISDLPANQQQAIRAGQYLGLARFYLRRGAIVPLYRECKTSGISFFTLVRYVFYLVKRRIFKLCYGFVI